MVKEYQILLKIIAYRQGFLFDQILPSARADIFSGIWKTQGKHFS